MTDGAGVDEETITITVAGGFDRASGGSHRSAVAEGHPGADRESRSTNELGPFWTVRPAGAAMKKGNDNVSDLVTEGFEYEIPAGGQEARRESYQAPPRECASQRAMQAGTPLDGQALVDTADTPEGKPGPDVVSEIVQASLGIRSEHHGEAITTTLFIRVDGHCQPVGLKLD